MGPPGFLMISRRGDEAQSLNIDYLFSLRPGGSARTKGKLPAAEIRRAGSLSQCFKHQNIINIIVI